MENDMKMGGKMCGACGCGCGCMCHKIIPVLVILFGLDFLLGMLGVLTVSFVSVSWPILVILAGCVKMFKGSCRCNAMHGEKMM